jgi:hypothetical protein
VLWLIGTHHGHGRPFFPPIADPKPDTRIDVADSSNVGLVARAGDVPLRMDQGWFERGARLLRRFGPWELARLEAILRLADHAVPTGRCDEVVAPAARRISINERDLTRQPSVRPRTPLHLVARRRPSV